MIHFILIRSKDGFISRFFPCSLKLSVLLYKMGRHEKLLARFLLKPKDFTYRELKKLLFRFGFEEDTGGQTSGSRVAFVHSEVDRKIRLHKPHHLGDSLSIAALNDTEHFLREEGFIL